MLRLHAELGDKIKDDKRQGLKLRADMLHVEAVLKLLEPTFNARSIADANERGLEAKRARVAAVRLSG